MVYFEVAGGDAGSSHYGPFVSLTQTLSSVENGELLDVVGHWGSLQPEEFYLYYVALHRGLGGPGNRVLSFICSARETLAVAPAEAMHERHRAAADDRAANAGRWGHTLGLQVTMDEKLKRLRVSPLAGKVGMGSRILWDFSDMGMASFYPLILFYDFVEKPDTPPSPPNVDFGPCHSMCYRRDAVRGTYAVEGTKVNNVKGLYHYEAALLSVEGLYVEFLSSGDPIIDHEGEWPLRRPGG